jgi:hypothetical protein
MTRTSHQDAALRERLLLALGALDELQRPGGPLPSRRNAGDDVPALPVLERRFAATIEAFDRCISRVEGSISGWDVIGGPIAIGAALSNREQETAQARADRKQLVKQWAATKSDAERFELVKRAERWYRISAEVLGGCQGVTPSLASGIVGQVKDVAGQAFDAGRAALSAVSTPLIYAGLGVGGLLVLLAAARRR